MNAPAPVVIKYQGSGDSAVNANQMLPCCYPVSFLRTTRSSWQLDCERGGEGGTALPAYHKKDQTKEPVLSSDISEIQYVIEKGNLNEWDA